MLKNNLSKSYENYIEEERILIAESSSYAMRFIKDSNLRKKYIFNVEKSVKEVRKNYLFESNNVEDFLKKFDRMKGSLPINVWNKSPVEVLETAAKNVHEARNSIMNSIRLQTSATSLALAKSHKKEGKTFDELLNKYSDRVSEGTRFSDLDNNKKSQVYIKLIERAGVPNAKFNLMGTFLSVSFKSLIVATYAVAIYNIYNADDKIDESIHQGSVIAGAEGGFSLGSGFAPAVCTPAALTGPGYFICVAAGVFVFSLVGAFIGSQAYKWAVQK